MSFISKVELKYQLKQMVIAANVVYHFLDNVKLKTALLKNSLSPQRWKHYIESENAFFSGISLALPLSDKLSATLDRDAVLILDRTKINKLKTFLINSNRVYLQTKGLVDHNYDPTAYKFESETPDELFVVDKLQPLNDYVVDIQLFKSNEMITKLVNDYKNKYKIKI